MAREAQESISGIVHHVRTSDTPEFGTREDRPDQRCAVSIREVVIPLSTDPLDAVWISFRIPHSAFGSLFFCGDLYSEEAARVRIFPEA